MLSHSQWIVKIRMCGSHVSLQEGVSIHSRFKPMFKCTSNLGVAEL